MCTKGLIWRIGMMGMNATPNNVLLFLAALERILLSEHVSCGSGLSAAEEVHRKHQG